MAIRTVFVCDRCHNEVVVDGVNAPPPMHWKYMILDKKEAIITEGTPMICLSCAGDLEKWFMAGKLKKENTI